MVKKNEHYRELLANKQTELLDSNAKSKDDRAPVELDQSKVGRLSRMDAMQVQAMSSAVEQRRKFELKRIDAALNRLNEGEYGYCVQCGDNIELERLELDPATPKCLTCAKASEH